MWHVRGTLGVHKGFWWRNLRGRNHLGEPDIDERKLRWVFRKWDVGDGLDLSGSV